MYPIFDGNFLYTGWQPISNVIYSFQFNNYINLAESYYNMRNYIPLQTPYGIFATKKELLLKVIDLDPNHLGAFEELANMQYSSYDLLNGARMTSGEMRCKIIELIPDHDKIPLADAYFKLACCPISYPTSINSVVFNSAVEIYYKVLDLNPNHADALIELVGGIVGFESEYSTPFLFLNGDSMTLTDACLKIIDLLPNDSYGYYLLSQFISDPIELLNGIKMSKFELIHKAFTLCTNDYNKEDYCNMLKELLRTKLEIETDCT